MSQKTEVNNHPTFVPSYEPSREDERKTSKRYNQLLEEWDKNKLNTKTETKALFLDNEDKVIRLLELDNQDIDPNKVFSTAQNENVSKIILAQNDPEDKIYPEKREENLLNRFKEASSHFRVKFGDFIIFSPWGYYSAMLNNDI